MSEPRPAGTTNSIAPTGERRLALLQAMLRVAGSVLEESGPERSALEAFVTELPVDRAEIWLHDGVRLVTERSKEQSRFWDESLEIGDAPSGGHGWAAMAAEPLPSLAVESGAGEPAHVLTVALRGSHRVLGALRLVRERPFEPEDIDLVNGLGVYLGTLVQLGGTLRRAMVEADNLEHASLERPPPADDLRGELARSHWLTALGQLAAGVAHDLNNSLNPVIAFAELIKVHAEQPGTVRHYADRVLLAARDGAETVRRIKRFTRRSGTGAPKEHLLLQEVVREVVELTRPTWPDRVPGGRVSVAESVDADLAIRGNAAELREALLNLINNALDAMPGGGTIRFVGRLEGDRAVLAVQDTGVGMREEVLGRVLEPFYTTRPHGGTGLGLPQVYGIMRRHGGDIEIQSWPGVGTTVLLTFPAIEAVRHTRQPATTPYTAGTRRRVLLVDDNVLSMEAMAAALRAAGHDVSTAESAEQALELFVPGGFDWVLTDLALPRRSGWDLLLELRRLHSDVKIGVLTGWSVEEAEERLRAEGVQLLMHKPVDPQELLVALS
jgi:signal transduction histidine kinase